MVNNALEVKIVVELTSFMSRQDFLFEKCWNDSVSL